MFKLVKILGKGNSVPEIITVNSPEVAVKAGSVYYLSNGCIGPDRTPNPVLFVSLEALPADHSEKKVHGFLITPGMLFEVDFVGDTNLVSLTDPFILQKSDDGYNDAVCNTTLSDPDGLGIVYSCENLYKTNKIQVLFT